jgi:small subunit ribosomal protein S23
MERKPCWVDVIGDIPPASVLVRTLPQEHPIVRERIKRVAGEPKRVAFAQSAPATTRNPRRLFMPREIRYEEDRLRQKFFQDHPWELARPKVVLESKGNEWRQYDWSKIQQPGKPLDGERCVVSGVSCLTCEFDCD